MSKHIIITKLFEFGGSNAHLKTLIAYFGKENVILLLEDEKQLPYLKNIPGAKETTVVVKSKIYPHAHLQYKFTTNTRELCYLIRSLFTIQLLSIRYGLADVTICSVEPEKHLYLLWLPFSKVLYILHTTPPKAYTRFTTYTCNKLLGKRKKVITVSRANKDTLCENWSISSDKRVFVIVVYNCINPDRRTTAPNKSFSINNKTVVTLGQVIGYKNPQVWLEVAKTVTSMRSNVSFVWLGNGPLLNEFVSATKAHDRIAFKGLTKQPDEYLANAAIYYQPSLFETHGIAVVEAMSYGLPCVVSNRGGLPESVENQVNGLLVNPENENEHVDAIIKLIDNEETSMLYGLNAYDRYMGKFTYDIFTLEMDKVYA